MNLGKEPLSRETGLKAPRALPSQRVRAIESSRITKPRSLPDVQQSRSHIHQPTGHQAGSKEGVYSRAAKPGDWGASLGSAAPQGGNDKFFMILGVETTNMVKVVGIYGDS